MDLIDKQQAIDAIMGEYPDAHYPDWYASKIKALPTAQPEPHEGEWIVHLYKVGVSRYECDACHARCDIIYPYCPYCGEKKEGERNATN